MKSLNESSGSSFSGFHSSDRESDENGSGDSDIPLAALLPPEPGL